MPCRLPGSRDQNAKRGASGVEELIPCLERDQGGTQAAGVQGRPLFPHTRSALLQLNSENIERILDRNEEIERLRTVVRIF